MALIDWAGVARNALWILGLSLTLAAWSYASWQASVRRSGLRRALSRASFQASFNLGLLLFSCGLAWSATRVWERAAWIALALAFAWQLVVAVRQLRTDGT